MTAVTGQCSCYDNYLLDPNKDPDTLLDNVLGPKQPLFTLIARLAEHHHIDLLQRLNSGKTALHATLSDDTRFGSHQDFAARYGAPFVPGELAPSHALRVLAGLGLVLAQEPPLEGPLRAAIGWYQEACGSLPGRSWPWSPGLLSRGDPELRRRLELLAEVAGEERDDGAVLTVAITLHRLAHPTGSAPTRRRWLRSTQPAVGVLFDEGSAGAQASLTADKLAGTQPGLVPDPERMSFFTADESFQSALVRAWSQAGQGKIDGTVLWSAVSREGPCPCAAGESAGAAFAVVLDEIRRLQRRLSAFTVIRRLVEDTSITGKIDDSGSLQSVEGYRNKLKVLPDHAKVVIPAVDIGQAKAATARELQIVPAKRWRDAAHSARRRSKLVLFRQAVAFTAVLALAGGGFAAVQERDAIAERQHQMSVNFATESNSTVGVNVRDADLYALAAWQSSHTESALSSLLSREADPYFGSFAEPARFIVGTMAISPDGRLLAVGGAADPQDTARSTVQLWDIATRRLLAAFAVPNAVRMVAFSPDGSTLAATPATRSGNLQIWSVATHRELPDPVAETGVITSIAYDPDSPLLAVGEAIPPGSRNGQPINLAKVNAVIDLWDLATHRLVRRLSGLAGPVWSLDFSDDGRLLASGGYDHTARLWDPGTGRQRAVLTGTAAPVQAVAFEPGGARILATSGADSRIRIWNAVTGTPDLSVNTSADATAAFAFSPGEPYLYAGLDFNDVFRVDVFTGNIAGDPIRLQQPVTQMAISPDGRFLVLGGPQGSLAALDIEGNTFYNLDQSPLTAAAINRSGQLAATGAADGGVHVWPVSDPATSVILRDGQEEVVSAAFSPDASLLAVGGADCRVTIWDFSSARHLVDISNAKRVADLAAPGTSGAPRVVALAFSRDGKTLATYCGNDTSPGSAVAMLWDTKTFHRLATYRPPGALSAAGMAYSPDGRTIALDTGTGSVLLWDTRLRRVTGQISVGTGMHYALAFSPDGRLLAITVGDTVQLWNVSSHVRVAVTSVNTSLFHDLAFSPDGSSLAGTSQDSTVQIWQVPSLQPIAALSPPTTPLATGTTPVAYNGLAYSPDGRTLVTASSDSTAQVWDLNPADEVRNLCDALRGPQLASQWQQLAPSPGPDPCPSE